jgi:hypothetical protein
VGADAAQSLNSNEHGHGGRRLYGVLLQTADWSSANVYYWDAQPAGAMPGTGWPGPAMTAAPDQGDNWYKFEFPSVTSTNLIFNNNGNGQTTDQSRNKDGWFRDGKWYDQKPAELVIRFKSPGTGPRPTSTTGTSRRRAPLPDAQWPGVAMQDDGSGWFSFRIVGAVAPT